MKILCVTNMWPRPEAPWLGVFVRDQVRALQQRGIEVEVFPIPGWQGRWRYLTATVRLAMLWRKGSWDLVHAHHGLAGLSAVLARGVAWRPRRPRRPVLITAHDGDLFAPSTVSIAPWLRVTAPARRWSLARADGVITVHPDHRPRTHRWTLAPCGVDLNRFRPMDRADAARQANLDPDPTLRRVFFPASPDRPEKRFDLAQDAMAALRASGQDGTLIAGGAIAPEAMPFFYNACDAVLLTSDYEASPGVLKEALACQRPVVSRPVGDAAALLNGLDGALVVTDDGAPGALAQALVRALSVRNVPEGRRRLVERGLTLEATVDKLIALYRDCLADRHNAGAGLWRRPWEEGER